MGMRKSVLLVASMALAVLLASELLALMVLTTGAPAQASFPAPKNGKIVFSEYVTSEEGNWNAELFAKIPYSAEVEQLTNNPL
jgi:hypothetical protein